MSTFKGYHYDHNLHELDHSLHLTPRTQQPKKYQWNGIWTTWLRCSAACVFLPFCSSLCTKNTLISSVAFLFLCNWHQTQMPCTWSLFGVPGFPSPYKLDHEDSTAPAEFQRRLFISSSWRSTQGAVCSSLLPSRVWWPFASCLWVQLQYFF